MAISISKYISVTNTVTSTGTGERVFTGLVFTQESMKSGVSGDKVTDFTNGKVIALSKDEIATYFDSTTALYNFANLYFGYDSRIQTIYAKKALSTETTPLATYSAAIAEFQNFGSFTFLNYASITNEQLTAVANANKDSGYAMIVPVTTSTASAMHTALDGITGVHIVMDALTTIDDDESTTANLGAWMPMSWYAAVDYSASNAAGTINYKVFGSTATVTSDGDKTTYDGYKVNYVGLVQAHGFQKKFYQQGKNQDGVDLGVFRDKCWLQGQVESGWIDLATNSNRIPANSDGASLVRLMVVDVAESAVTNGIILANKPLTSAQETQINQYANDTGAANTVATVGYYVTSYITKNASGDYECTYVLIYAKGDHIYKVNGSHILV